MKRSTIKHHWSVPDERGWSVVAREVVALLRPGSVLALQGPLGAGKTTFVQALAKELAAERVPKSPTFSMLRTYRVRRPSASLGTGWIQRLLHVDAYRIEHERDLIPLDLDAELAASDAILVIEWPEHAAHWLKSRPHLILRIKILKQGRKAEIQNDQ